MVTIVTGNNSVAITVDDTSTVTNFKNEGTRIFNKGALRVELIRDTVNFFDKDHDDERVLTVNIVNVPTTVDGTTLTPSNAIATLDSLFRSESSSGGGGGTGPSVINNLTSTSTTDALSANMGRELKSQIDGMADQTNVIWVNGAYTGTLENGESSSPYKTINAAISAAPMSSLILICSGGYNEDVRFVNKHNITIAPVITVGNQPRVEVNGGLDIDESSYRIGIKGIEFNGSSQIDSSNGNIYLEQVNFNTSCVLEGNGYVSARTCWFNGLSWTDGNVELNGCYNENLSTWQLNATPNSSKIFAARNCLYPVFNHTGGVVIGVDNYYGKTSDTNTSIYSSASGSTDAIIITGGSTQQADGTYGTITKLGQCSYSLGTLAVGNDASLTLSGTRIDSGLGGSQVFVYQSTPGYTRTSAALRDHLIGISNKLLELSGTTAKGNITQSSDNDISLVIGDSDVKLSIGWFSADGTTHGAGLLYMKATSDSGSTVSANVTIRRVSIYGDASQGATLNSVSATPALVDDILANGTDWVRVEVIRDETWYNVMVAITDGGAVKMKYTKVM